MLAINHALGGAIIGLTITNPVLAVPLAFASHFALDALPHFDPPGDEKTRLSAKEFRVQLALDAFLCFLLVLFLAISQPKDWILAAVCAFVATSPDLFWIPRYLNFTKHGKLGPHDNFFLRFHHKVQWRTGPELLWVEALWFAGALTAVVTLSI